MGKEEIMKILVMHGPNLNLLGVRKPEVYGLTGLSDLNKYITEYFKKIEISFFQSNHEGELIDQLQATVGKYDGAVLNAGALTHYSYALRDAIESISVPVVEVHISNVHSREEFRRQSVIAPVCIGSVSGFGIYSYILGIQALAHQLKENR